MYEIYMAQVGDQIVYIGSGRRGRHKHITSGTSHVYCLNKIHFKAPTSIKVTVLHDNLSKERSLELELELIQKYEPTFNSVGCKTLNNKYEQHIYYEEIMNKKPLAGVERVRPKNFKPKAIPNPPPPPPKR